MNWPKLQNVRNKAVLDRADFELILNRLSSVETGIGDLAFHRLDDGIEHWYQRLRGAIGEICDLINERHGGSDWGER